jgi:tyramine---L-glutamate ligase
LQLCSDKVQMAEHFATNEIPTIPTRRWYTTQMPAEFPCVVKPRYGAGSWLVRLIRTPADWEAVIAEYRLASLDELLLQPYVAGLACSLAALRHQTGPPEFLPVAEQILSADGTFQYKGGRIPARIDPPSAACIRSLAQRALATIPAWSGYVGLDILIPDDNPHQPLLVEINPRLTTSYIGYRQLCQANLMERLLFPKRFPRPLSWNQTPICFTPHGDNL